MTDQTESSVSSDLENNADDSRFLVHHRQEILRILRSLASHNALVSAFFNHGNDLLLTSVLQVNADRGTLLLDYGSNELSNKRILASEKIIFVTALDQVKIQFVSPSISATSHEGRKAFSIPLPPQVLQLQRREYYRLTTPIVNPLRCRIAVEDGNVVELPLVDISAGGVCLMLANPPEVELKLGDMFHGCRLELPGVGTLETTLRVQNMFEVTMKNGSRSLRSGCQFIDMRPAMQALVQRYMVKLERERIASTPH